MSEVTGRLGKNVQGYYGERIDIARVTRDCRLAAEKSGWRVEPLQVSEKIELLTLFRPATGPVEQPFRLYISAGIHGDEPAGPMAALQLLLDNFWPPEMEFWLCPCLNPSGFVLNHRENEAGVDLNRQYLEPTQPETLSHIAWLKKQPNFDLCLCLHEDWESHGFYVYELNPDGRPSLSELMVKRVADVCLIDPSDVIEGRPAQNGIIRPSIDPRSRPQWPEAFFLLSYKTRLSYTLEAPSDFPLPTRVAALVAGVRAAIRGSRQGDEDGFQGAGRA